MLAHDVLGEAEDKPVLVVAPRNGNTLLLWNGAVLGEATRATLAGNAGLIGGRRDAVLELPSSGVLRPTVRLPNASPRVLREALTYELEKLSPIPPDQVCFDFRILSRDREANTAEVELRIIRREIVDGALRQCRAGDIAIESIRFEGDPRPADAQAFPVDRVAMLRGVWRRHSLALLGAMAAVLLIAALLALYQRGAATLDALSEEMVMEGARASRVEQLQHRIDQAGTQLAFLSRQKQQPLFAAVLADVAHTLPEGSWIGELAMSGNKIRLSGYSRSASDLIALFDRSGRFVNAQFSAPVTQSATPGVERFDLTFEVAGQSAGPAK
jgi:general secretion pathway protein L